MQNRGVNAISAGFKSACGLLVPLDFDPVGLWAALSNSRACAANLQQFPILFRSNSSKCLFVCLGGDESQSRRSTAETSGDRIIL